MSQQFKILIVDDLKENLTALEAILEPEGYSVIKAFSGEEALRVLLREHIDMVLMDVCMPGINGVETSGLIRKHKRFEELPIIFITAADHDSKIILDAYGHNAIDFVFKPIDRNILLAKLRVFLALIEKKEERFLMERRQKELLKRHAVELSKVTQEIERTKNALDEFTYIASHDLKEPLRGIGNYAQFIEEDYADVLPEEGKRKLRVIHDLVSRQDTQIAALLEYSRVGRDHVEEVDFEVQELIKAIDEDLSALKSEKAVEIVIVNDFPPVRGPKAIISRIFYNLINNGIKYNRSEKIIIEVGYRAEGQCFFVRDNGIGIREEDKEKVFKIFKRLAIPKEFGRGTGAGLSIVKKIVHEMDGEIWIESEVDKGSTFCFTLPRVIKN